MRQSRWRPYSKRYSLCKGLSAADEGMKLANHVSFFFKCQVKMLHTSVVKYNQTEPFRGARVRFWGGCEIIHALEQQLGLAAVQKKILNL
jgi:hypothetical protein